MSGSWSRRADRDLEERGSFCQNALPSQPRNKGSNSKVHAGFAMDGKPTILLLSERMSDNNRPFHQSRRSQSPPLFERRSFSRSTFMSSIGIAATVVSSCDKSAPKTVAVLSLLSRHLPDQRHGSGTSAAKERVARSDPEPAGDPICRAT